MPLVVRRESEVFCLDFTRELNYTYVPYEATIPEVIYKRCPQRGGGQSNDRVAIHFDSEHLDMTFARLKTEMEQLAAGFLAAGLRSFNETVQDRILICGFNHSQLVVSALAAARAGLVFGLATPNFSQEPSSQAEQLKHQLELGGFRALLLFCSTGGGSDKAYQLAAAVCPEVRTSHSGQIRSKALPKLTHIILADEDHKHVGTYTLSELFNKSSKERLERLPDYTKCDPHQLALIQFTQGASGPFKAVGLSHYQLINGCRIAAHAIGINKRDTVLACALPLFRAPVFALVALAPFLLEGMTAVVPEPSPIPKNLFSSINKYQCSHVLSNAAAMRLAMKMALTMQKVSLPTVQTMILLGERVSAGLLTSIERVMPNAKHIAVGMWCAELGAIPLLSDNTTNLVKAVGKSLEGYAVEVAVDPAHINNNNNSSKPQNLPPQRTKSTEKKAVQSSLPLSSALVGELRIRALAKTKFLGYGPKFTESSEWVPTGDIAAVNADGNVELIAHKDDLIYDARHKLVEHWRMERVMAQSSEELRGVQVVQIAPGGPIIAVVQPKRPLNPEDRRTAELKNELCTACREENLPIPGQFAAVADFPRVNTRIQKFKLRAMLKSGMLKTF